MSLGLPGTPSTVPSESGDPKQHLFTCSTASGRPCEGEEGFLQTYSGDCRQNQSPRESPSSRPAALHRSELESPEPALGPTHPSPRPIELPFKHILIQLRPEPDRPGGAGAGAGSRVVPSGGLKYCRIVPFTQFCSCPRTPGPQQPRCGPRPPVTRGQPVCRDILRAACAIKRAVNLLFPTRPPVCFPCGKIVTARSLPCQPASVSRSGHSTLTLLCSGHHRPSP